MDCVFCGIVAGQIPATIVYEDDEIIAFDDIQPHAEVHKLIIPRLHIAGMSDVGAEHQALLGHLLLVAQKLAESEGLSSYRVLNNCGEDAGQTVFHLHLHLLGGQVLTTQLA